MTKKNQNKLKPNLSVEHLVGRKKLNQVLIRCKYSIEKKKDELKYKGDFYDNKEEEIESEQGSFQDLVVFREI